MRAGVLFSGGKDSTFSIYSAKLAGHEVVCLMTMHSYNKDSYMFHTPSVTKTKKQAELMDIPLIVEETKGEKEKELEDLHRIIKRAVDEYNIEMVVTGALYSNYQADRIQEICDRMGLKCFNPSWHKDEIQYLQEIVDNNFKVIITGVSAYPLNKSWIGRYIDDDFIKDVEKLQKKYQVHPAGEGGEFESFVVDCPLFQRPLRIVDKKISGENHYWRMELDVE